MKSKITLSMIMASSLLFIGCSGKYDPTPNMLVESEIEYKSFSPKVMIKKGDTLKDVISMIRTENPEKILVDKTNSDIIFDQDLGEISASDMLSFLKLSCGKDVLIRKYSEKMFVFEEMSATSKPRKDIVTDGYSLPNLDFKINGEFTYGQLFNILREKGINIYADIYNKKDAEAFNYKKTVPEFLGNLKSFLDFISSKENLFVITEKNGVRLKDVQTVSYNLNLPKIKMNPVLNAGGWDTAISVSGGMDGGDSSASGVGSSMGVAGSAGTQSSMTNGAASGAQREIVVKAEADDAISPLNDLDEQIKEMLGDRVKYNINKSNGTVSVTGDYESIKTADKVVQDFHDIYSKHVNIEMHIYEVVISDENAFGVDYNLLGTELFGSGKLISLVSDTTSSSNFFREPNVPGALKIQDSANAESLIFKYLNKYGRTKILTKPQLGTVNNLPVRLNIIDSKDYVYKISNTTSTSTTNGLANTSSGLEPVIKTVQTGFSMVVHPKIEGEYVKVAIESIISNLNGFTDVTYGEKDEDGERPNTLSLKDVSAREFAETVKVKEGEIAIIGGFQYEKIVTNKSGVPFTGSADSALDFASSTKDRVKQKVEIVITIKATAR